MTKTLQIEAIQLAYQEINGGQTNTIIFIHGNSSSHKTWVNQMASKDLAGYRLIAIDLPAHGESGASPTPDEHYGLSDLGRIMGEAIGRLCPGNRYIVIGFSLGANVVCEALPAIKPVGLVLAGPSIVGQDYSFASISLPNPNTQVLFTEDANPQLVQAFYESVGFRNKPGLLADHLADYNRVKVPFRSVLYQQTLIAGKCADEIAMLKNSKIPVCLIFGQEEQVINPDYLDKVAANIWQNKVFKIPEAGHFVYLEQPTVFNNLVAAFAAGQFKEYRA